MNETRKLKISSSWMDYRDTLSGEPQAFNTNGRLRGVKFGWGRGRLPELYRDAFMDSIGDIEYTIYSFDTPIAWRIDGVWIIPDVKYGVATKRHQDKIRAAIGEMDK